MPILLNSNSVLKPATVHAVDSAGKERQFTQAFVNLDAYMNTWASDKGLNGIIATWWASTIKTIEPHPMNQAPYILGLLAIYAVKNESSWLERATHEADCIIKQIDTDGLLHNGWGDVPGAPKAPVIGLAAVGALYATAATSGIDSYIQAADKILKGYELKFSGSNTLNHFVSNQNARWALTKIQRYKLLDDENDLAQAVEITDRYLLNQMSSGSNKGGIFQSDFSDVLISVYGGKCIYPLVAMYETTGDLKYLRAAESQAEMLLSNRDTDEGLFIGQITPSGKLYDAFNIASKIERRISKKKNITTALRRKFVDSWETSKYPIYIARAADTIKGLGALSSHNEEFKKPYLELLDNLLTRQYQTGGFPNSVGYHGLKNEENWQDVVPSSRWNAYVYHLLADLISSKNHLELPTSTISWPMKKIIGPSDKHTIVETQDSVTLQLNSGAESKNKNAWIIEKATGNIKASEKWINLTTGTRSKKQMQLDRAVISHDKFNSY